MLNLEVSHLAEEDLLQIWLYSADTWSRAQADHYIDSLYATFETLCDMPSIASMRPDISPNVRMHPVAQHWVFFEATDSTLTVIRILGQRQDWRAILLD